MKAFLFIVIFIALPAETFAGGFHDFVEGFVNTSAERASRNQCARRYSYRTCAQMEEDDERNQRLEALENQRYWQQMQINQQRQKIEQLQYQNR